MNSISLMALKIAIYFITRSIDKGFLEKIQELVIAGFGMVGSQVGSSGKERRAVFDAKLNALTGSLAESLAETSGWALDMIISGYVGDFRLKNPDMFPEKKI